MPSVSELESQLEEARRLAAAPVVVGRTATGAEVRVGDTVTITCKVTGVHHATHYDDAGHASEGHDLNLSVDGKRHSFTVDALVCCKVP